MLQYTARITSQEPVTDALIADIDHARYVAERGIQIAEGVSQELANLAGDQEKFESASLRISNVIQKQVCDLTVYGISSGGYVDIRRRDTCPVYTGNEGPTTTMPLVPKTGQIRLTLYSDYAQLKRQVDSLSARLTQLEATTKITPVTDTTLRRQYDQMGKKWGRTLYPQYGDWILTSDVDDQHISFSGLRVDIGRSIYIQTRRKAYLNANGHSFYGLPGDSTSVSRWLSNNTTYRFVRASSDSWLVTASSSPYPWT